MSAAAFSWARRLLHVGELPVRGHPPKFDRDAVGGRLVADIVEHDLGAAAAIEDDSRRSDQQVADAGLGPALPVAAKQPGQAARRKFIRSTESSGDPPLLLQFGAVASSLVRNGYFSVNHARLPAASTAYW